VALAAVIHGEREGPPPDMVASGVGLPTMLATMSLAIAAGTEVGHVMGGVAMTEGSASAVSRRPRHPPIWKRLAVNG